MEMAGTGAVFLVLVACMWCVGPARACDAWEFRCGSGECIQIKFLCDGRRTCLDASDEKNCGAVNPDDYTPPPCYEGHIQCSNGRCIYGRWRCDGEDDCGDASDEKHCNVIATPPTRVADGLSTEAIIGITVALAALLLLGAAGASLFLYFRRKFHMESVRRRRIRQLLEPDGGLPYNFPQEALLREPPPRYTSQQDLRAIAHVNPGYHDDEMARPPPCYTSQLDVSRLSVCSNGSYEPPPSYCSRLDVSAESGISREDLARGIHLGGGVGGGGGGEGGVAIAGRRGFLDTSFMSSVSQPPTFAPLAPSLPLGGDITNERRHKRLHGSDSAIKAMEKIRGGLSVSSTDTSDLKRLKIECGKSISASTPHLASRVGPSLTSSHRVQKGQVRERPQSDGTASITQGGSHTEGKIATISATVHEPKLPAVLAGWRDKAVDYVTGSVSHRDQRVAADSAVLSAAGIQKARSTPALDYVPDVTDAANADRNRCGPLSLAPPASESFLTPEGSSNKRVRSASEDCLESVHTSAQRVHPGPCATAARSVDDVYCSPLAATDVISGNATKHDAVRSSGSIDNRKYGRRGTPQSSPGGRFSGFASRSMNDLNRHSDFHLGGNRSARETVSDIHLDENSSGMKNATECTTEYDRRDGVDMRSSLTGSDTGSEGVARSESTPPRDWSPNNGEKSYYNSSFDVTHKQDNEAFQCEHVCSASHSLPNIPRHLSAPPGEWKTSVC